MDACFVIGGDGTLLNLMEEAVSNDVPVEELGMDN